MLGRVENYLHDVPIRCNESYGFRNVGTVRTKKHEEWSCITCFLVFGCVNSMEERIYAGSRITLNTK